VAHKYDIEHLYKYRSLSGCSSQFVERLLLNSELYFPRPKEFNDPFDCCPASSFSYSTQDELATYICGLYRRQKPHLSRAERRRQVSIDCKKLLRKSKHERDQIIKSVIEESVNSAGVLSLSTKHNNILMWSHYADSHRGVCFRFKASSTTPFFGRAQPVIYQSARPVLNPIRDNSDTQVDAALLTKAELWSYEDEWRIVEHDQGPGVHNFPAELLDAVILGACISSEDRQKLLKWIALRKQKMEVLTARIDSDEFRLDILREA
jgi:hypothetical protein